MSKRVERWELDVVNDSADARPALPNLFDGSPAGREQRDVVRKFQLDVWTQEGVAFKAGLAAYEVEQLERGAFDRSVNVVDYMVRQRDAIAYPEVRDFAHQLMRQLGPHHAELQARLVDITAGRLLDIATRDISPDKEPERQAGFWERVLGQ
jgi:hypothetical protein